MSWQLGKMFSFSIVVIFKRVWSVLVMFRGLVNHEIRWLTKELLYLQSTPKKTWVEEKKLHCDSSILSNLNKYEMYRVSYNPFQRGNVKENLIYYLIISFRKQKDLTLLQKYHLLPRYSINLPAFYLFFPCCETQEGIVVTVYFLDVRRTNYLP